MKGRTTKTVSKKDENLELKNDSLMESEMTDSNNQADEEIMDDDDIIKAEENLGMHYFQGDVLTTNDQNAKLNRMLDRGLNSQLQSRALVKDVRRTWTNGIVPFVIKDNVDNVRKGIVKAAIKHWQEKTCIKFKPKENEKDYVEFEQGDGCSSYVGRIKGKQDLTVGNKRHGCRVGNIIHEIGHAIGFFHEQSRPDRDDFVKIEWGNVKRDYKVNFLKFSTRVIDSKDVGYDYDSVMHYPRKIFGKKPSKPTVIPKKNPNADIGQRKGLSKLDIIQVNKLYGCQAKPHSEADTDMNNNTADSEDDNEMNTML
mgnify:FL=1